MSYKAVFSGWDSLGIEDLLIAYKKAKADCFFENTFPVASKFAEYEKNLLLNLNKLLNRLVKENGFLNNDKLLGNFRLLPKKLSTVKKSDIEKDGHVYFSNPDKAVLNMFNSCDVVPEFRIVGDFPVDTHIISALWINMIGHKFDEKLGNSCYGARLKRIRDDEFITQEGNQSFHISSIGSFVPYFQPYQKWRSDGLTSIRNELKNGRDVIAVSLDLKSYYHYIDPEVIRSNELYKTLDLILTKEEQNFTEQLAIFLKKWSKSATVFAEPIVSNSEVIRGGLAIGLTCSRIISNVLLHRWDTIVLEKLSPIHYGRYVDDMFLVLRDTGKISSSLDLMNFFQERMGKRIFFQNREKRNVWEINQGKKIQCDSVIALQSDKQKIFVLQGQAGIDLLDSIEKEIYELSSEHRLMPSPDQLEHSIAAKVLSAASNVSENADTLRKADGLTIRRLGWALQLRHVETLARDLPSKEWKKQRKDFYLFAQNHILRADNLFAHFNYLSRLFGFSINMNDWCQTFKIVNSTYQAIDKLETEIGIDKLVRINGADVYSLDKLWSYIKATLTYLIIDAVIRYYSPSELFSNHLGIKKKAKHSFFKKLNKIYLLENLDFNINNLEKSARLVALCDLAKQPYKYILNHAYSKKFLITEQKKSKEKEILKILNNSGILDGEVFEHFIKSTRQKRLGLQSNEQGHNDSYMPYFFPTRPPTPLEISELATECVGFSSDFPLKLNFSPIVFLAKYTQVLRGVCIRPILLRDESIGKNNKTKKVSKRLKIQIGIGTKEKIIVALTNLLTEEEDWDATASNKPNLSQERYKRISMLVNDVIKLRPKPDYVIFPELSIPLCWLNSIINRLSAVGISVIAGTEYRHSYKNMVQSDAVLVLSENRLGYPTFVKIWQPKNEPAVGEDKVLTTKYGKTWGPFTNVAKPIYIHKGINLGVMVCSELQNSKERIRFQGLIDALIVLSWNRDLDTFSALIESAALDIHSYIVLVNNRKYGDSRVRTPAKESFLRDIARVKGGDNDFIIAATLDIAALRAFQSRAKRWPEEGDKFKPLPEGFKLLKNRIKLPPK